MNEITKEDFIARLKENKKEFSSIEENINYKLEVIQYYLHNHISPLYSLNSNEIVFDYNTITVLYSDAAKAVQITNYAFEELTKRLEEFE